MNNLKFRAWHKQEKKMYEVSSITWDKYQVDGIVFEVVNDHITISCWANDIVLMQSTGLKDTKGIEVFHGDIVKLNHMILRVTWDEDFAQPCLENALEAEHLGSMISSVQVIGNIYEHPKLLETGNE